MLIDEFMPAYDVHERHTRLIQASAQTVFESLKAVDLRRSMLVTVLFKLRGLPDYALSLDGLDRIGFTLLAEQPPQEIVLGLVGQFWRLTGEIVRTNPVEFPQFDRPGYTKAAWNFSLEERGHATLLATETRVQCTDEHSRRRFKMYWSVIGPFSGLIRREMLRLAAQTAE